MAGVAVVRGALQGPSGAVGTVNTSQQHRREDRRTLGNEKPTTGSHSSTSTCISLKKVWVSKVAALYYKKLQLFMITKDVYSAMLAAL